MLRLSDLGVGSGTVIVDYFPLFMDLRGSLCVVVGGGAVASRKATALLRAGARVHVVAPQLDAVLARSLTAGRITQRAGSYATSDLQAAYLVIAATDDRELNARVSRDAKHLRIPVNVVDDPALCTFIMPAVVDRSPLLVAVSSSGTTPVLTRSLRATIEAAVPPRVAELAQLCASLRAEVKATLPGLDVRRRFWEAVLDGPAAQLALHGDGAAAESLMLQLLAEHAANVITPRGEVVLIGVGSGEPDLLVLRALRCLQRAELVTHAAEVPPAVLELARRDASQLPAPSSEDRAYAAHLAYCLSQAQAGRRVCVLDIGELAHTPLASRWLRACSDAGVPCQVVPGISAVTARD